MREVEKEVQNGISQPGASSPFDYVSDPYKMLATHLVAELSAYSLERILRDNEFIKQLIISEIQEYDLPTPFADCVSDLTHRNHTRVRYKRAQADFAMYLYSELDIPRLKAEVRQFLYDLGITEEELSEITNKERSSNEPK